ncbi:MAG: hypothetical protein K2X66_15505 [Cyanobacteria bacterium]|nr:hypothetical protein [Cyanobacteriota bacterium]
MKYYDAYEMTVAELHQLLKEDDDDTVQGEIVTRPGWVKKKLPKVSSPKNMNILKFR